MSTTPLCLRFVNEPTDRYPFSHGANIVACDHDRLICVWFAGSFEGHGDTAVLMAECRVSANAHRWAGPSWSEPTLVAFEEGRAVGNPVLFCASSQEWWLFYTSFPPRRGNDTLVRYRKSFDEGRSWSPAATLSDRLGYWTRHPVVAGADGGWLLPLCALQPRPPICMLWRTHDRGASWTESVIAGSENRLQPSLVQLAPGRLHACFRDCESRHVYQAASFDDGRTWTPVQPAALPNNNSSVQALRLRSGELALVCNDQVWRQRRSPLSIFASSDAGQTWPVRQEIISYVDIDATVAQFSYPSLAQTADGTIHVAFTHGHDRIAHAVVDETSLLAEPRRLVTQVGDIFNRAGYMARTLRPGEPVYFGEKKDVIQELPSFLLGQLAVCPLNTEEARLDPSERYLRLRLSQAATVIVAYDANAKRLPAWLSRFTWLGEEIVSLRGRFRLYAADFPAGEQWCGGNLQPPATGAKQMYFLFALPGESVIPGGRGKI